MLYMEGKPFSLGSRIYACVFLFAECPGPEEELENKWQI